MRRASFGICAVLLMAVVSCSRESGTINANYGNSVITGEVAMSGTALGSPAGVEVSIPGTGMRTVLGADGTFAFAGVPDRAELHFRRAADGVEATMRLESGASHVVVALAQSSATQSSRRRSAARGGAPVFEFDGVIRSVTKDSLVVFNSTRGEVTIGLSRETLIRERNMQTTTDELQVGWRVLVKSHKVGEAFNALVIIVQSRGNEPVATQYTGSVISISETELVIYGPYREPTAFAMAGTTEVRRGTSAASPADIHVGSVVDITASIAPDGAKTARHITIKSKR